MFKKKDLDIDSIFKEAVVSTKKQMVEAVTPVTQLPASKPSQATDAFIEPFDPEKHLNWLRIRPENWAKKGTIDAQEIDAVLEAILGGPPPKGIASFKQTLSNINKFLGKKPGQFKLPVSSTGGISPSVRSLFGSLQLNNILHSIIYAQDPSVAGKMFEGLVARMVGGMKPSRSDDIEDLLDDAGNLVSLKLIDDKASTIEGSKLNLALGIAKASQTNANGGVTYLVCAKDKNENPFKFVTFSFLINRNNFFNFVLKKGSKASDLTEADVDNVINSLTGGSKMEKAGAFTAFKISNTDKNFAESLDNYAISKGSPSDRKSINATIKKIVADNNSKLEDIRVANYRLYEEYFKSLIMKAEGETGKAIQTSEFTRVKEAMLRLINLASDEEKKMELFEDDPKIRVQIEKAKSSGNMDELETIRTNRRTVYNKKYNEALRMAVDTRTFIDDIQDLMEKSVTSIKQSYMDKGKQFSANLSANQALMNKINNFFNTLTKANANVGGETQFKISTDQARELALITDANFDDSYEEFIVDAGFLFNGAERSTELLKDWILPIAENYHNIMNDLKRYYIKDELSGITDASTHSEDLKSAIDNHIVEKEKIGKDLTPSQIGENVKKDLTDDFSASILEWVRNLK